MPPPGAVVATILERIAPGKEKQDAVRAVYDSFIKEYTKPAEDYFASIEDLRKALAKKPLAEADTRKAVSGTAEAQKQMLTAAENFWEALQKALGTDLFGKVVAEINKPGPQPRVPIQSIAVLVSPLSPEIAVVLGQYLHIQPAQLERFKKQSIEDQIDRAAAEFIEGTQRLIQDFAKAGPGNWAAYFQRAKKQVDAEASVALLEVKMWRAFNDALSADQVRDYWTLFFWEKTRAFYLPALMTPPPLLTQ